MNATEFNTEMQKLCSRAIADGVAAKQMPFESLLGILELHKSALLDWHKQATMLRQMQAQETPLIIPSGDARLTSPTAQPPNR